MALALADWQHFFEDGEPDSPVLLTLHGTGSNERDIAGLGRSLDPRAGILSVRGRVLENGMSRWFARLAEGVFDVDDVERRSAELADFVGMARDHYGLAGRRFVAVGFSNGANIALATVLEHPEALSAAIAFSGMYPFADRTPDARLDDSTVLLLNGRSDPMAPAASVARAAAVLSGAGARVARHERDGGHGIDDTDLAAARDWLSRLG